MKKTIICCLIILGCATSAYAIKSSLFVNIDHLIGHSPAIFIAKVLKNPPKRGHFGAEKFNIQIQKVLKGKVKLGTAKLEALTLLEEHKTYLLFHNGGSSADVDYFAFAELSVIEIPFNFNINELNNKKLKDQIKLILKARHTENNRRLRMLKEENQLLKKALRLE